MIERTVLCARCKTHKPESEYYTSINRSWCKPCRRAYGRAKWAALTAEERQEAGQISTLKRIIRRAS